MLLGNRAFFFCGLVPRHDPAFEKRGFRSMATIPSHLAVDNDIAIKSARITNIQIRKNHSCFIVK